MKDYPSRDGNWTCEELEKLGKALGYHPKVFHDHLPPSSTWTSQGIRFEDLTLALQTDLLYPIFHKTYNHQDGAYNLKVILKSINLLQKRYISFSQLHNARVSFQTYENTDHAGLEDKHMMRGLKLCYMVMAPERLKLLLQHMDRLVSDRIMLYEFLDLVSSAESLEVVEKDLGSTKEISDKLDKRGLYDLCNFKEMLSTHDDRCLTHLNKQFGEMLKIIPVAKTKIDGENVDDVMIWATPPLVNKNVRKNMTLERKAQMEVLEQYVETSNDKIKDCNHGNKCQCCHSTPTSTDIKNNCGKNQKENVQKQDTTGGELIEMTRPPLVTDQDKEETVEKIQNLQWELATKRYHAKKKLNDDRKVKETNN